MWRRNEPLNLGQRPTPPCRFRQSRSPTQASGYIGRRWNRSWNSLVRTHFGNSLGIEMTQKINRIGHRYGRWLVITEAIRTRPGFVRWICLCDCGNTKEVPGSVLGRGDSKSCGCLHNELAAEAIKRGSNHPLREANRIVSTTHGATRASKPTKAYRAWSHMIGRCCSPTDRAYGNYGGRGIYVCERWRNSFEAFLEDMGNPASALTLDRKDNDGPYSKENCRWITRKEQNRNKRNNRYLEFQGRRLTLAEWGEHTGLSGTVLWKRLNRGWSIEKTLTMPHQRLNAIGLRAGA